MRSSKPWHLVFSILTISLNSGRVLFTSSAHLLSRKRHSTTLKVHWIHSRASLLRFPHSVSAFESIGPRGQKNPHQPCKMITEAACAESKVRTYLLNWHNASKLFCKICRWTAGTVLVRLIHFNCFYSPRPLTRHILCEGAILCSMFKSLSKIP